MKQKMNRLAEKLLTKKNKRIYGLIAIFLALTLGFIELSQMFNFLVNAGETPAQYIGEVRVYQGKTVADATSSCKKDGFIPVNGNLNEGTDYDAVVLGYSTTENPDEAVTDVRMMQMTSGFSTVNYAELVERQYPGVNTLINNQYKAIQEFRKKLKEGSYNAGIALSYLNVFEIPETGMKLGDYYNSNSLDKGMLKKLFLQTASTVSTTSFNLLAMGVSDSSDDNWASRVYEKKKVLEPEDEEEADKISVDELDKKYLSDAEDLVAVIQDFSTKLQNGLARMDKNGGKLPELDPEKVSPEEMNEHGTESLYIAAYDILNQYNYDDEKLLGDWFVEMGNLKLCKKAELRNLYPLVASMSDAQIFMLRLAGIQCCVYYLKDLSSADDKFKENLNKLKSACHDFDKTNTISVWAGVDQKMFEQECAVTSDAQRYTNIKDTADNLVKRNKTIEFLENVSTFLSYASSIAGLATLLSLPMTIIGWVGESAAVWCWNHYTVYMIFNVLGKIASVAGTFSKIALVVIIIIMVIVFLYELFKPECDDLDYTDIPTMAMDLSVDDSDSDERVLWRYDLIRGPDGKADINAYEGKQWNALYTTQNPDAGKPIRVVSGKDPFIVQYNESANPAGYKAVKNFDEIFAANLNANVRENEAPDIFLFYAAKGEAADTTEVKDENSSEGQSQEVNSDTDNNPSETAVTAEPASDKKIKYISSVYLSSEESETLAKLKLTQKGYKVVDINLSPSARFDNRYGIKIKKGYTYLGYTVTTNVKAAITDIRIAKVQSTSRAVLYGNIRYTAAGYDAHGNSICYTKDSAAGSPILADNIQVADRLTEGKEGHEVISYFGGTAYNFDPCEYADKWDNAKYVFFIPSEMETSEKEYISGLFFVSGADIAESGLSLKEYGEKLGGKLLGDADFTKGKEWQEIRDFSDDNITSTVIKIRTYLYYTTTHDPKRAIYDVQFYAGTPKMQNFATLLTAYTGNSDANYSQTGYAITSVFMQCGRGDKMFSQSSPMKYKESVYHYELNNYDDFSVSHGNASKFTDNYSDNILNGVKWDVVGAQPRMLFTCGFKEGYKPLTKDTLILSGSKDVPEGFSSVQDVKFPFEKEPLNLAYYFSEKSDECTPVYMYIGRTAPVKGKYIASVKVATYNPDESWGEEEREANDKFSNDLCYIALCSSSTEIINQNLSVLPDEAWYNVTARRIYGSYAKNKAVGTEEYDATAAAYLGVTYTDNPAQAVHGLLRFKAQDGVKPSETMTVNGAKYSLVTNCSSNEPVPITSPDNKKYYLYTTTSSGASSVGEPITEIYVSEMPFEPNMSTILTVDHGDIEAERDFYGNKISDAEYAVPYGDADDTLFIHHDITNLKLSGIDSFYVGAGDSEKAALCDLLTQGATNYFPLNLNEGAGTEAHTYLGYHYYNPDYVNTKRTKYYMENAIKDLYLYVGNDPAKRLTIDKRKYTLCSTRSLNDGSDGVPIYLYQTTALINDKDKKEASYITAVAATKFDSVPEDIAEMKWENLLSVDKERVNVNEGVTGFNMTDEDEHMIDSRIFLYVHRNDNYVKPEAVITGGYFTGSTEFGDVVLNKK